MRHQALADLIKRYARIFRQSWMQRKEADTPKLQPHESQFLPAALALRDTPVHPAPRVAIWLILVFTLLALIWAIFGRIDVVATAAGKVIPNDHTKVIQPMETAVIKAIHVRDGETVQAGQVLIELDGTVATADTDRLHNEILNAQLEALRAQALLASLASGAPPRLRPPAGVGADRLMAEQSQASGQYQEYQARQLQLQAEITRRQAELQAMQEQVTKLEQTVPIARQRAQDYQRLMKDNFISQHGYLEREQARIEQEQDLAASRARIAEIRAELLEAQRQQDTLDAEMRRRFLDQHNQALLRVASLEQELVKAEQRRSLMHLTAPVSGSVQQLAVHTIGGVVTPAQPLMVIVPRDNALEVEALLPNKDIGFVNAGQNAEIKVEAFPFTKYGTLHGIVTHVSSDAIQDEKLGLVYVTRVKLARDTLQVANKMVRLSPGMAVRVEVKTGTRQIIEYFLSPLMQYSHESLRER